jgi:hypothetical protein
MATVTIVDEIESRFSFVEHPPPHFINASCAEPVAQIEIFPARVLRGSLHPAKLAPIRTWAVANRETSRQAWGALAAGQKPKSLL